MLALRALSRRRVIPLLYRTNATLQTNSSTADAVPPPAPLDATPKHASASALKPRLASGSTTPEAAPNSTSDHEGPSSQHKLKPKTRGRTKRGSSKATVRTGRTKLSLKNPKQWNRPVKKGIIPAYDEALKIIYADSARLKDELKAAKTRIAELEKLEEKDEAVLTELEELKAKVDVLNIQAYINLPAVRWRAANGMGMSLQVHFLQ